MQWYGTGHKSLWTLYIVDLKEKLQINADEDDGNLLSSNYIFEICIALPATTKVIILVYNGSLFIFTAFTLYAKTYYNQYIHPYR